MIDKKINNLNIQMKQKNCNLKILNVLVKKENQIKDIFDLLNINSMKIVRKLLVLENENFYLNKFRGAINDK